MGGLGSTPFAAALLASLTLGATGAAAEEASAAALSRAVFARAEPARQMSLPARPDSAARFDKANALRAAGVARTAVDRSFGRDEVVGALGFLCGRPDNLNSDGAADAYGHDPHGRFLGAKLSVAF